MWDEEEMPREGFDTAQVCLNGHMINAWTIRRPKYSQKYCDICGALAITECPNCDTPIRGLAFSTTLLGAGHSQIPSNFCHECGKAYPWMQGKLDAASELADTLDALTPDEKRQLKQDFDDLVAETPRTAVAALKFKALMAKAGKGAAECFKDILTSVLAETAKKMILDS
ncbi:MAG: DUF2321 domain-containing protein [Armatimonadota bacterium]